MILSFPLSPPFARVCCILQKNKPTPKSRVSTQKWDYSGTGEYHKKIISRRTPHKLLLYKAILLSSLLNKNWLIAKPDADDVALLIRELKVVPVVAQLLVNRKIIDVEEARPLVDPDLSLLHDPFLMLGMRAAVDRILLAIEAKEKITLFCDYDVDGVTSAAFMTHFFRDLNVAVDTYLPDRHAEGYGINENAVRKIREGGSSLMITADCGITNVREVELAKQLGLDVIVSDHHQVGEAGARQGRSSVLNPHQTGMHVSLPFLKRCRHCVQTGDSGAQRIAS